MAEEFRLFLKNTNWSIAGVTPQGHDGSGNNGGYSCFLKLLKIVHSTKNISQKGM